MKRELLHGEDVIIPSTCEWHSIAERGALEGLPINGSVVVSWLGEYGHIPQAMLGARKLRNKWWLLPLLYIHGRYYRVHFENVVCEHCNQRCGPSAKPETVEYAGTGLSVTEAWAEFSSLPVQACPHCSGTLRRRHTIWLAAGSPSVAQPGVQADVHEKP